MIETVAVNLNALTQAASPIIWSTMMRATKALSLLLLLASNSALGAAKIARLVTEGPWRATCDGVPNAKGVLIGTNASAAIQAAIDAQVVTRTQWMPGTAYSNGQTVFNKGNFYQVTRAGISGIGGSVAATTVAAGGLKRSGRTITATVRATGWCPGQAVTLVTTGADRAIYPPDIYFVATYTGAKISACPLGASTGGTAITFDVPGGVTGANSVNSATLARTTAGPNATGAGIVDGTVTWTSLPQTSARVTIPANCVGTFTNPTGVQVDDLRKIPSDSPVNTGRGGFRNASDLFHTPQMYGAVVDGVTDDSAAVQACIYNSIFTGIECKLSGFYNVGTHTMHLCEPIDSRGAKVTGTLGVTSDNLGSVVQYQGSGDAFDCTTGANLNAAGSGINPSGGYLRGISIYYQNPSATGAGVHLIDTYNMAFDNVVIQVTFNTSYTQNGSALQDGVRIEGGGIIYFSRWYFGGVSDSNLNPNFIDNAVHIVDSLAGGGANGALWFSDMSHNSVRRGYNINGSAYNVIIKDNQFDFTNNPVMIQAPPGGQTVSSFQLRGNLHSAYGLTPESALVAIDHTLSGRVMIDGIIEENASSAADASNAFRLVVPAANISRSGAVVTVRCDTASAFCSGAGPLFTPNTSAQCIPFAAPAGSVPTMLQGGGNWGASKIYKVQGGGAPYGADAYPSGMFTVTSVSNDKRGGCNVYNPNIGACNPTAPCNRFTYNDGNSLGKGSPNGPVVFIAGLAGVEEFESQASQDNQSYIRLLVRNNILNNGIYAHYVMGAAQSGWGAPNFTSISAERNYVHKNSSSPQLAPRNPNSVWGAGTGAMGYTLPEWVGSIGEIFLSASPDNSAVHPTAANNPVNISVEHWRHNGRVVSTGGAVTDYIPDGADFCSCRDLTRPTTTCPLSTTTITTIPNSCTAGADNCRLGGTLSCCPAAAKNDVIETNCW